MNNLNKNITKLYLLDIFSSTQFQSVVAVLFLLAKGFNLGQAFLFGSIYAAGALLSQIPTGYISDKYGRKTSLILATIIELPAFIVVILSHSFVLIGIMYFIFGIAASFTSGTDTAILYDTLRGIGKENEFKKINGKLKWYGAWGGAIGGIIGAFLAKYNLAYAWWAWVGVLVVMFFIQITLVEPPKDFIKKEEPYLKNIGRSMKIAFKGEASFFILYAAIIWFFFWLGWSLWQPYLKLTNLPVVYFGFFYAGISLISGFVSKQAHLIEKKIGMRLSLLIAPILLALAFILESKIIFVFSFLIIVIQAIASGYFIPVLEDYVNVNIPSETRATVLSVKNMISQLIFMVFSPLVGYFSNLYSLQTALLLIGCILFVTSIIFFFYFKIAAKDY